MKYPSFFIGIAMLFTLAFWYFSTQEVEAPVAEIESVTEIDL